MPRAPQMTHMPPELIIEGKMSKAVDRYSFGVVLWELCAPADISIAREVVVQRSVEGRGLWSGQLELLGNQGLCPGFCPLFI